MVLRQRIISEIYDESNDKVVNREIIQDKAIKRPEVIEDLGYNHKEQIDILREVQNDFFFCSICISQDII